VGLEQLGEGVVPHRLNLLTLIAVNSRPDVEGVAVVPADLRQNLRKR
jgi:hypothetical protein